MDSPWNTHKLTQTNDGWQWRSGRAQEGTIAQDRARALRNHNVWRLAHPNCKRIMLSPELKRLARATTAPESPAPQVQADRAAAACS